MPSPDRVNSANGYRHRDFDTRAGTLDVAIPKLRTGTYFPNWLLERRRRTERALSRSWRPAACLKCRPGGWKSSSRPSGSLADQVAGLRVAADLDEQVAGVPDPPAGRGPYTFVAADALAMKVREAGRVVNVVVLVAIGVNGDGHREVLGVKVTSETTVPRGTPSSPT